MSSRAFATSALLLLFTFGLSNGNRTLKLSSTLLPSLPGADPGGSITGAEESTGSKSKPTITLEGSYDGAEGSISFGPLRRPEAPSEKVPADILGLFDKPKFVTQETADQHPECLKYIHLEEEHTIYCVVAVTEEPQIGHPSG